jgi:hypothetical protein
MMLVDDYYQLFLILFQRRVIFVLMRSYHHVIDPVFVEEMNKNHFSRIKFKQIKKSFVELPL